MAKKMKFKTENEAMIFANGLQMKGNIVSITWDNKGNFFVQVVKG